MQQFLSHPTLRTTRTPGAQKPSRRAKKVYLRAKPTVSMNLPPELIARLDALAAQHKRTRSNMVDVILSEHLDLWEARNAKPGAPSQ